MALGNTYNTCAAQRGGRRGGWGCWGTRAFGFSRCYGILGFFCVCVCGGVLIHNTAGVLASNCEYYWADRMVCSPVVTTRTCRWHHFFMVLSWSLFWIYVEGGSARLGVHIQNIRLHSDIIKRQSTQWTEERCKMRFIVSYLAQQLLSVVVSVVYICQWCLWSCGNQTPASVWPPPGPSTGPRHRESAQSVVCRRRRRGRRRSFYF